MGVNVDPWYNTDEKGEGTLDYLSVALLGACNMKCIFCYVDGDRPGMWDPEELEPVLEEAHDLGMRKIQLSGGEPLAYPHLKTVLEKLSGLDIDILLATNATLVTQENAELLARHRVNVGVSFETIDEEVSDMLSDVPGSHTKKLRGIEMLKEAGYTQSPDLPMNVIMKTLIHNFPTYIDTWNWAKEQGIQPILDRAIPGERCKAEWVVKPAQLRYLLDQIGEIEGVYHKIPFVNNEGCNRMGSSAHIEVDGNIFPCAGIPVSMGDVREQSLTSIWTNSTLVQQLQNYQDNISGSCGSCIETVICCGCRAVAYATTGNLFGPDTLCFNYEKNRLPVHEEK
jgi:radical SAM protein with 4Fe4S-binding SPASM domain